MGDLGELAGTAVRVVGALLVYFAPTVVAAARRADRRQLAYVVNLALGWTGVGWVAALVLALLPADPDAPGRRRRPTIPPEWLEE